MQTNFRGRDFIGDLDFTKEEVETVLDVAWDLKRKRARVFFMKVAVFAAICGPLPDEGSEHSVHHSPGRAARSWRAFDLRMATNVSK